MPMQPFGGKLLILSGDLRQLLPVVKRGVRAKIVNACITKSERLWQQTQILHLTTNMKCERLLRRGDPASASQIQEYADWLLRLGGDGSLLLQALVQIPTLMLSRAT